MNNCEKCKYQIQTDWYFCPNCGKILKEKPITIRKQIGIYLVSFFLAPLGLGWGFRYIRSKDKKIKLVGIISIVLTVISMVLLILAFKNLMDQYSTMLNNYGVGSTLK